MIIATAGHVDHGKSSLVRALTGVETDTLAEEIERGLSINLGYAYLSLPEEANASDRSIGFIDVPGHSRFINTMISGISGIDMGLLVVAADDGPMPQTLEHIDVLELLGVPRLTVVISKIDQVEPQRIVQVREQLDALLTSERWPERATFAISSQSGAGLDSLKMHLLDAADGRRRETPTEGFRLSIDRCFNVNGVGLVVTGTASAGRVNKGDRLQLLPSSKAVRVRHLRANNADVELAESGQRVALGLSGKIAASDITRGDWLVAPGSPSPSSRLDVRIRLLPNAPFPLKHMAPLKCYLGAKRIAGRVAIVAEAEGRIEPGCACLAQLLLEEPVSAVWGEPILLRDHAETRILGGGRVLDPEGPKYGKSRPDRLCWLRALEITDATTSLAQLLQGERAIDLTRFWAIRNVQHPPDDVELPTLSKVFEREGRTWATRGTVWSSVEAWLDQYIDDWHRHHPMQAGIKTAELNAEMGSKFDLNIAAAVLESQLRAGQLTLRDGHVRRRGFEPAKSQEALEHWQQLRTQLGQAGRLPPLLSDLLTQTGLSVEQGRAALRIGLGQSDLHQLNNNRVALPGQLMYFFQCLEEAEAAGETLAVGTVKKRFQAGRNLTVEILEYFDTLRLTRREGNARKLLGRANVKHALGIAR